MLFYKVSVRASDLSKAQIFNLKEKIMDKSILKELKRLRNIRGTIIGEKLNGYRCEVDVEVIKNFIDFLESTPSKELDVDEMNKFLLVNQLLNLLALDNFEVMLK